MTRRLANEERCAEHARFLRLDAAFKAGDLAALRAAVDDSAAIPNGPMPLAIGSCLEYAIYHSPLAFIQTLLEMGANPNPDLGDHAGFPPLIAALSSSRAAPGRVPRTDTIDALDLLLRHGADPNQRGVNDYTPLHMAVAVNHAPAVDVLLSAGADPRLRTRIDACETPREAALRAGLAALAERLRVAEERMERVTREEPRLG